MIFDVLGFCAYQLKGTFQCLPPGLLPLLHGDLGEKAMRECQVCSHLSEVHMYSSQTRDCCTAALSQGTGIDDSSGATVQGSQTFVVSDNAHSQGV